MKSNVVNLIGNSQVIVDLKQEIDRVARSDAKVLISGESGSGKEVVARAIHAQSDRADRAVVPVNCAGIPETLLESELFGHVKGSFTGAYRDKPGKLELADGGTAFLDEVGEMTLRMPGLLLRFLETGELQKVGTDRALGAVNVRVIAAPDRRLEDLVAQGQFRDDLFYRLNVIRFSVPPLRERREDIPLLVDAALKLFSGNGNGCVVHDFGPDAMEAMCAYAWPGNVRELQNIVERLVVTGRNAVVAVDDLPQELRSRLLPRPRRERRRTVADELFKRLIDDRESFWSAVYPLYMNREITKANI